jgi:hypothetical protein
MSTRSMKYLKSREILSIISMNSKKENFFFEKKCYFLYSMIDFFEKVYSFLCLKFFFRKRNFDILTATKMLIDVDSNDDVSSNVDNWNSIDDEIYFFIIDFEATIFFKLFNTCFRIDILSYYFSSLFLNICNEIARYVT